MSQKYRVVRIPREAFDKITDKKSAMERDIQHLTGKPTKITMPQMWKIVSVSTVEIPKMNLIKFSKPKFKLRGDRYVFK